MVAEHATAGDVVPVREPGVLLSASAVVELGHLSAGMGDTHLYTVPMQADYVRRSLLTPERRPGLEKPVCGVVVIPL